MDFFEQHSKNGAIKIFDDTRNHMKFIALPYDVSDDKKEPQNVYLVIGLPTSDSIGK